MKIAFLLKSFPCLSETFILNQIISLIREGHEVTIHANTRSNEAIVHEDYVTYHLSERTKYLYKRPKAKWMLRSKAMLLCVFHFIRSPSKISKGLWFLLTDYKKRFSYQRLFWFLQLESQCYDILFCHFGTMGQDIASSKKCGISGHLVTMFHGVDIRLGLERGGQIYQELFDTGELFLSISEYNKTNLLAFGVPSEKLMTLPVGIFPELFKSNNSKTTDPVKIITVARLVHEKGIEFGIRAVDMLLKRNPHFNLQYTIVGAGCLEQSLKQLVSELKLENSIIFCGAKNQQEVRDLLADSNLFLLPSIAEALPVSIMEAHAAELPVVASNVGSVNQLVIDGQSGFIVEPKDVAGLSNKLEYLIQHPHIWTEFGMVGRNHISLNYNNTVLCKKLIEFFQFLL